MGSHTNSKFLAPRMLTLTTSLLTLILFGYYANDITADMTAGAPQIPIRTFEDVVHYDFKVVVSSSYYAYILSKAKPGSGMRMTYETNFEQKKNSWEAMEAVLDDPKTLMFWGSNIVSSNTTWKKRLTQVVELSMDNLYFTLAGLGLQQDSEFLQGCNFQ